MVSIVLDLLQLEQLFILYTVDMADKTEEHDACFHRRHTVVLTLSTVVEWI